MASLRQATTDDLISIQTANLLSLPENYHMKFYYYHILSWPELSWVAEDDKGRIVGYVLGKLDEEETKYNVGQITSLAVFRTYRRLGLAEMLMRQSQKMMILLYNCKYCNLHVRESNYAAIHLYRDVLHFHLADVDVKYYADQENGLSMSHNLEEYAKELNLPASQLHHIDPSLDQAPTEPSEAPETAIEPKNDLLVEDQNKPEKSNEPSSSNVNKTTSTPARQNKNKKHRRK